MRLFKTILFLSVGSGLVASPIGNPAAPALMNSGFFSMCYPFVKGTSGYLADYISDKRYVLQNGSAEFDPDKTFKRFGLHSQMGTISLVFLSRLEMYGYLGGSKEHLKWHSAPPPTSLYDTIFGFHTDYHFSWQAGMRLVLLQWGQTFFSLDGSYFAVPSSQHAFFKFFNRLALPIDSEKQKFNMREWQVAAALSSRFWLLTPYAGMVYLHSKLHIQAGPENTTLTYRNQERIGYFYGITLSLGCKFHLNFERRVRDEFAYLFSTQAVF